LIGIQGIALATVVNFALQFAFMFVIYRRLMQERIEANVRG
jgi:hypothetical protein